MARGDHDRLVTQSLVDRLIDLEPKVAQDTPMTRAQSVRNLRAQVRRDLEMLLNTRRNPEAAGPSLPELARSVYNFGLPDFTHVSLSNGDQREVLQEQIEQTIKFFEPRLQQVEVTLLPAATSYEQKLRFQIEALLMMDPAPEKISFDTVLSLASGEYQVRGERSA
jgi:type VI secretion system protein ImpF